MRGKINTTPITRQVNKLAVLFISNKLLAASANESAENLKIKKALEFFKVIKAFKSFP